MQGKTMLPFIFLLIAVFSACHKYDEGPKFSLRSPYGRAEGTWTIDHYYNSGIDKKDSILAQSCSTPIQLYADNNNMKIRMRPVIANCSLEGEWNLNEHKDSLYLFFTDYAPFNPVGPYGITQKTGWKIKKLRNDEMNLECTYNGSLWRLELSQ